MKKRFRMFQRGSVFYAHDAESGQQISLKTKDRRQAERLLLAKNEADEQPLMNLALARTYLAAHDPKMVTRTWAQVIEVFSSNGRTSTLERCARAFSSAPFAVIRDKTLVETTAEDLLSVCWQGGTSTNNYMRGLHNLALNLGWLGWPILPKKAWPKIRYKVRRAITSAEHRRVVETECNAERALCYEFLWETGGSQSDIANLSRANIDQVNDVLFFQRQKLAEDCQPARIRIGKRLASLLTRVPKTGYFFPAVQEMPARYRSAEFWRRCQILKIYGVSLHSYRYAWAERTPLAAEGEKIRPAPPPKPMLESASPMTRLIAAVCDNSYQKKDSFGIQQTDEYGARRDVAQLRGREDRQTFIPWRQLSDPVRGEFLHSQGEGAQVASAHLNFLRGKGNAELVFGLYA